jgi:pyrimidine deaminase RibD-like protein
MNRYDKMKVELLGSAKAAHDYLPIRVHELALKYEIEQRHVCEKLGEFHAEKLIRLSAWDDNEGRDKPFDEWPNTDAFFACRWDGNYKRVQLLARGSEFLENLAASALPPTGQQQADGADRDRTFARLAIDEARKSIPESDGRPHPKVGAVVVKDGKVLSTAHRGEVPGNHAEFTALERNLPDVAVAGATVYTTLEPCTTRNPPKIPCADRLIERRVARVVIGILDPDDRIRGKGQRKLSNAGIETSLFPHDLAMEVEELNRDFTRSCEQQSQEQMVAGSSEKDKSSLIRGDVLQVYAGDDGNHDGNLIVLLRLVSGLPNPVTIIDFQLKVTTDDGEILEGHVYRGALDWVLITEHKEAARYSPVTSIVKTSYDKLEPPLLHTVENEPLVHGIHRQGWLVFAFPSDDGWAVMEKLRRAKSITLSIVDSLKREYQVPITQPWNQPSKILHESWFPK